VNLVANDGGIPAAIRGRPLVLAHTVEA